MKKEILIFLTGLLLLPAALIFAQNENQNKGAVPEKGEAVEIEGAEKPEEKELQRRLPDIVKPAPQRTGLSPAEQMKLDELERDYAAGRITQAEYEVEKDALFRQSHVIF